MGLHLATFALVADLDGYDVRAATYEQAAKAWVVLDRVMDLSGEVSFGREMARDYLRRCRPRHEVTGALNALEDQAREIVTPAFLEQVTGLARTVH